MGYVGTPRAAPPTAPPRVSGPRRIGSSPVVHETTATLILPPAQAGGSWTFGPEIGIERRETTRDMRRMAGEGGRTVTFVRSEFRLGRDLRRFGIAPGASLFVGEMPLGQRRVHRLRVQGAHERLEPVVFEALADMEAPFGTPEARAAADDVAAVAALGQKLRRNPFLSDRQMSASLSNGDLAAFATYGDEGGDGARQRADAAYAIGLVAAAQAARTALYTDPRLRRRFDETGAGRLHFRFSGGADPVALPPEVADKAAGHLDLAIAQALCGAGRRVAEWEGRPVAAYAAYLFEQHVLAALRRREGDLAPTLAWREGFDPMAEDGLEWRPGLDGEADPDDDLGLPRVSR